MTLESGQYIEMESAAACRLYDARGAVLSTVAPRGDPPTLAAGDNRLAFTCDPPEGASARARVTVVARGEPLRP